MEHKFKAGKRVTIVSGTKTGAAGIITECTGTSMSEYMVILDGEDQARIFHDENLQYEDLMENDVVDEPFLEMATIAIDQKLNINVNPEPGRLSIAYFRVFNAKSFRTATLVARLHFKDNGMDYHRDLSGKQPWALNSKEIKHIVRLMQKPNTDNKQYTNWQVACYQWNLENGLINQGMRDYFAGKYDHKYDNDTRLREAYVPSTQEMPEEGWIYDPSNGK